MSIILRVEWNDMKLNEVKLKMSVMVVDAVYSKCVVFSIFFTDVHS